jgi:hypothetical protein
MVAGTAEAMVALILRGMLGSILRALTRQGLLLITQGRTTRTLTITTMGTMASTTITAGAPGAGAAGGAGGGATPTTSIPTAASW